MEYYKHDGDLKYKLVSLRSEQETEFRSFGTQTCISYDQDNVLVLLREGEPEPVIVPQPKRPLSWQAVGNRIRIPDTVETSRMWVVSRANPDMHYKVPAILPQKDEWYEMVIPGGAENVYLSGDQYFLAAYRIE